MIEELHPDSIVLDFQMHGIGGFQIFEMMQEHPEGSLIPVIAITS
jgi:CheY-like chemotaxis protein